MPIISLRAVFTRSLGSSANKSLYSLAMPIAQPLTRTTSSSSRSPSPPAKRPKLDPELKTPSTPKNQPAAKRARNGPPPSVQPNLELENADASSSKDYGALMEGEMSGDIDCKVERYERELDYENKLVLAPMVRTGSCELLLVPNSAYSMGVVGASEKEKCLLTRFCPCLQYRLYVSCAYILLSPHLFLFP